MKQKKIKTKWLYLATLLLIGLGILLYFKDDILEFFKADITVSHHYEWDVNAQPKSLKDYQNINEDVVMLLQFEDEQQLRQLPVVSTDNGDKYMFRSLTHDYDAMGTVFIDEATPWGSEHHILNGHSSKRNDHQFTFLKKYQDSDYFQEHPYFQTVEETGIHLYGVIGFYEFDLEKDTEENPIPLSWFQSHYTSSEEISAMLKEIKPYSLQYREINLTQKIPLLTLLTCNMEKNDSRYVLIAMKIQ